MSGTDYDDLLAAAESLMEDVPGWVANAANLTALMAERIARLNWVGFYVRRGEELIVGPFQGRAACVRIPIGRGVCGTAAAERRAVLVPDVHAFPGHIACDPVSRSELVVPLLRDGEVLGVLDLDSPAPARFTEADRDGCERLAALFVARCPGPYTV